MKLQRKGEFLSTRVQYIPLGRIRPNPQQPRRSFDEEGLAELAASIRSCGILQPLTVRRAGEGYELWPGSGGCGPPGSPDCGRCRAWWPRWGRRTPPCWP